MKMVLLMVATLLLPSMLDDAERPAIDYHQHLLSPSAARLGSLPNTFTARDLIPLLDAAGIERALVLSLAYQYGNPNRPAVKDEYAKVKAENDWTARQVAQYPRRLRAFCGVDPPEGLRACGDRAMCEGPISAFWTEAALWELRCGYGSAAGGGQGARGLPGCG
jgi:predicted TIM-barrel fold metal-dependent hydrolase